MATLDLDDLTFLAPVSDLSDTLSLGQYEESATNGARTEVRTYAGGRRRLVSRPGATLQVSVAYRFVLRADYQSLLDLLGQVVLFRDQRGRQVFGVLSDVSGRETFVPADRVEDVSFTITEVTYSEIA